jgi:transposase-like protein
MTESIVEGKAAKADQWRERVAAQEQGGLSVRRFCKEQGLTEHSFYAWRRRLREQGPVRFALVERRLARQEPADAAGLELILATGARLRIGAGVNAATLRTVLEALRA